MTTGTHEIKYVSWSQQFASGKGIVAHSVCPLFSIGPDTEKDAVNFFARIYSHIAINDLPDRALDELLDTLKGMVEFYSKPLILERPSIPAKTIKAKLGKSYVRPHLTITED